MKKEITTKSGFKCKIDDVVLDVHEAVFIHVVPLFAGNVYVVPDILPHVPLFVQLLNVYVVVFVIIASVAFTVPPPCEL